MEELFVKHSCKKISLYGKKLCPWHTFMYESLYNDSAEMD